MARRMGSVDDLAIVSVNNTPSAADLLVTKPGGETGTGNASGSRVRTNRKSTAAKSSRGGPVPKLPILSSTVPLPTGPGGYDSGSASSRTSRMFSKLTANEHETLKTASLRAIPRSEDEGGRVRDGKPGYYLQPQPEPPKLQTARIYHGSSDKPSVFDTMKQKEAKREANSQTMRGLKNPYLGPMVDPNYEIRARTRPSVNRRIELQVTPWFWPENQENDRKFMSIALACEIKLQEVLASAGANADLALPDRQRTAICCHILDQISKADGPFQSLISSLKEQIFSSIYAKYHEKREGYHLEPYYELTPYFLNSQELEMDCYQLKRTNKTMRLELDTKDERLSELIEQLDSTKKELTRVKQAKARLENDHAATLASLTQTKAQLNAVEEDCEYLRSQLFEAAHELNELGKTLEKDGEIAMLRDKVTKLSEELKVTMTEREELKAAALKMVPKNDYNILNAEKQAALKTLYNLKTAHATLQTKYDEVLPIAAEYLERKGRLTPRPKFESVLADFESELVWRDPFSADGKDAKATTEIMSEVIKLANRYKAELAALKKSHEIMAEELADMKLFLEGDDEPEVSAMSSGKQFVALGTHSSIPKYLRFNGKVRNRCLTRRDIDLLIKDVWHQKAEYDKHRERNEDLSTYVSTYLQRRFGIQSMVAEWGYNVIDALERYSEHDLVCDVFGRILKGEISEEVHTWLLDETSEKILKRFQKLNLTEEGKNTGKILKKTIFTNMRNMFPDKSKEQILLLKKALHKDESGKLVEYAPLFAMTTDGRYKTFVEQLRAQAMEEIDTYMDALEQHLMRDAQDTPYPNRGQLTLLQIRNIIKMHDNFRRLDQIDTYLSKGSQTSVGLLKPDTMIDAETFFKNMCKHTLVRPIKRHEGMMELKRKRKNRRKKEKIVDVCGSWGALPPPGSLLPPLDLSSAHLSQVSLGSFASPMPPHHMNSPGGVSSIAGSGTESVPGSPGAIGPLTAIARRQTRTRRGSIWQGLGIQNAPVMSQDAANAEGLGSPAGKLSASARDLDAAVAVAATSTGSVVGDGDGGGGASGGPTPAINVTSSPTSSGPPQLRSTPPSGPPMPSPRRRGATLQRSNTQPIRRSTLNPDR